MGTLLQGRRTGLFGKSVLIRARSQFTSVLLMMELDGLAGRMVVAPPDFDGERLASAIRQAEVEAVVSDVPISDIGLDLPYFGTGALEQDDSSPGEAIDTEWTLATSGTSGAPKLVAHVLGGLLGNTPARATGKLRPIWSTFYDIRRYGGMQIYLRAATSGAALILTEAEESLADHVARMAAAGVTHVSGTPSHWRRLLMSGEAARIKPRYVRLSGEIADRAILEALKSAFPSAEIVHAYASTEAGVGFEVADGRAGFPASYLDGGGEVELRVVDNSLRVRSRRTARRFIGRDDLALADGEGFVDTDDLVERKGDRFYFKGRRAGAINVGGLKVHPEEVEQVINSHEAVRASLVKARRSPITGDLIVAQVMLKDLDTTPDRRSRLHNEILAGCRQRLERHKVPVMIDFVASLAVSAGGKLRRGSA